MGRRKGVNVPTLPRVVLARVGGRVVAELKADERGIVPGSVVLRCDPAGLSGPDKERVVAQVVKEAGFDPKTDHETVYQMLFPRPE